jgi:trans-AT polyketide synthase/acyltransferase/oxidoreductase domain-containing protein
MFSGQGSQHYQMGKELYEQHGIFRKWMERLDAEARNLMGRSLVEVLYERGKTEDAAFDEIRLTNPAIFSVEYALYRVFAESGITPDAVLGVSLGEYAAAAAAGVLSWRETLSLVIAQAEAFENRCPKGAMCAVLYDPDLFHKTPLLYEQSELAARHYPNHFVVSGAPGAIASIEAYLDERGIGFLHLPVSFGFHSARIDPCETALRSLLEGWRFLEPQIRFISCQRGEAMSALTSDHWWDVVRRPVEFQRTIETLERRQPCVYVDLGPTGTLANFAKQNFRDDSASEAFPVLSPFGKESARLERVLASLSPG